VQSQFRRGSDLSGSARGPQGRKPAATIDLGKLNEPPRVRRPLYLAHIADWTTRLAVTLDSPRDDDFYARLRDRAQFQERLLKNSRFAVSNGSSPSVYFSLWNRPCTLVFLCPESTLLANSGGAAEVTEIRTWQAVQPPIASATALQNVKRVVILGRGGSDKSTLARRLGEITNLPVVELDKVFCATWSRCYASG
jgi:hypothetical protein